MLEGRGDIGERFEFSRWYESMWTSFDHEPLVGVQAISNRTGSPQTRIRSTRHTYNDVADDHDSVDGPRYGLHKEHTASARRLPSLR